MSRFGLRPSFSAAMLFIAAALGAQESGSTPTATPAKSSMSPKMQDLLKRFDKNGDGKLDDDERADAQEVMMKERIEKQVAGASPAALETLRTRLYGQFDKDKDGKLDPDERAAAAKAVEEKLANETSGSQREQLLRRFDRNTDGKLDQEEAMAVVQFLAELPAGAPAPGGATPAPAVRANLDFRPVEKAIRAAIEADAGARGRFDKNKDGKIDDEEWSSARWEIASSLLPSPAEEQKRLESVAAEVARRREQREMAQGLVVGGKAISALPPDDVARLRKKPYESLSPEEIRALAVADEVARRRKAREEANK